MELPQPQKAGRTRGPADWSARLPRSAIRAAGNLGREAKHPTHHCANRQPPPWLSIAGSPVLKLGSKMGTSLRVILAGLLCACGGTRLPQPVMGTVSVGRVASAPSPGDTTARARAMLEARQRADAAALLVDTIVVTPPGLEVTIGSPLSLFPSVRTVARDSTGRAIPGFTPVFSLADNTMATLRQGMITGLREGVTTLRVEAMVFTDTLRPLRRTRTAIPLTVRSDGSGGRGSPAAGSVSGPPSIADSRRDSIPRELVEALMGRGARIIVGGTTDVFPQTLFRNATVLGSRVSAGNTTTIVSFPWPQPVARDSLRTRLLAAGWSAATLPTPPQSGGFVGSSQPFGNPDVFCRESEQLSFGTVAAEPSRIVMALSSIPSQGRAACDRSSITGHAFGLDEENPIPQLTPPPGTRVLGMGSGGGGGDWYAEARVVDRGPIAPILAHYVEQMVAARWTAEEQTVLSGVGITTFSRRNERGRNLHAVLTVIGPEGRRFIDLRLSVRSLP